jgi:nucleotide-binding universal stress UspA family protein
VWHFPAAYGWEPTGADGDFEGDAHQILADALTAVESLRSGLAVLPLVEEGPPAEVLLRAAKGADLLVVGSRGRGGLRSALIGSVSGNVTLSGLRSQASRARLNQPVDTVPVWRK